MAQKLSKSIQINTGHEPKKVPMRTQKDSLWNLFLQATFSSLLTYVATSALTCSHPPTTLEMEATPATAHKIEVPDAAASAVGPPHRTLALGHRPTANKSRMRWTRAVTTITTVRVFNKTTTRAELERELSYRPKANEWRRQTRKRSHR